MNLERSKTWRSVITGQLLICALLLIQIQTTFAQQDHFIPLLPPASTLSHQGFVRIINHSDRQGTIRIHAIDDTGRRFGPVSLTVDAKETAHFTSQDLERGAISKGLSGGVGNGHGNWRLELQTTLNIEPLAYVRRTGGFLTSIHDLVGEAGTCHHVPIFNPGSNTGAQSLMRLFNPGARNAEVTISGRDDRGALPPAGHIRLTLPAGASRTITAQQLESGGSAFSGRFGNGGGKWQLFVSADQPILVMSLLWSQATGHLTNLSTSPFGTSSQVDCNDFGGSGGGSGDLRVESVSVSDDTLAVLQTFTLYATIYNSSANTSRPSEVIAYWSFLPGESATRNRMGSSSVPALSSRERRRISISGLSAGILPGNFYFLACVEDQNRDEHCSEAIRVTVSSNGVSGGPDLESFGQYEFPPNLTVGQSIRISTTVINSGSVASAATTIRLYRSDNNIISRNDSQIDSQSLPAIAPQFFEYVEFSSVRLTSAGTYYYGFCVDAVSGETNTANNCWAAGDPVTISSGSVNPPPPPPPPPGRSVTVSVRDGCNDTYRIDYRYFAYDSSNTRTGSWPGGTRFYHTTHYNRVVTHRLECDDETATICLGARQGNLSWGVGFNADRGCTACCYSCPSSGNRTYRTFGFGCPR